MPGKGKPFKKGQSGNPGGRPKGSKGIYKDMCWDSIGKVVKLVFHTPEPELVEWVKENVKELSRAEKVFLEKSKDIETLKWLIERVCGKAPQETRMALSQLPDEDLIAMAKEALAEFGGEE